jgi:hypothetical protein
MKTTRFTLLGICVSLFAIVACQRNLHNDFPAPGSTVNPQPVKNSAQLVKKSAQPVKKSVSSSSVADPNAYAITLIGPNQVDGNWEWVWSVKNSNPGNGKNGTVQDLSHWGMKFGSCLDWTSVVAAAYSSDGVNWKSFRPTYQVDPTSCLIEPVLKFDFGTTGSNTAYFRLILNKEYDVDENASGYYKSGSTTGCTQIYFRGIASCDVFWS